MGVLVIEGVRNERLESLFGVLILKVQAALDTAHVAIRRFQYSNVEAFLAAKIVIDHALAGLGPRGNIVHAGAAEAFAGELRGRDFYDVALGSLGVVNPLAAHFRTMKGLVFHRSRGRTSALGWVIEHAAALAKHQEW